MQEESVGDATEEGLVINRPCWLVHDDWFTLPGEEKKRPPGVYQHGETVKGDKVYLFNNHICGPLHVVASSCDSNQYNFGIMLRFKNIRGHWNNWLMPADMLSSDCNELRSELLRHGLYLDYKFKNLLPVYLQSQHPKKELECALKVGWHGNSFVLPDRVIGIREDLFFQSNHSVIAPYEQRGSLLDWQNNVAAYCTGNPVMMFQACCGFAGPLLKRCDMEYAGFHVYGGSSLGKTTGQHVCCSVWGGKEFMKTWTATANGLEAGATLYNDCVYPLDELSNAAPEEVNKTIYLLGNSVGKQRANIHGRAKQTHSWNVVLLSNGEKTLDEMFKEKKLKVKAGQRARSWSSLLQVSMELLITCMVSVTVLSLPTPLKPIVQSITGLQESVILKNW